jgi:hypothetical protein
MKFKIWYIPAVIITYILYKKYELSTRVNVFFDHIDFSPMSIFNPTLDLVVRVNNPTQVTASIDNISGNLFVDGSNIGTVYGIPTQKLLMGSTLIKIPITLNYGGVINLIKNYNKKGFSITFKGSMIVDAIPLPLDFNYTF